MVEGDTEDVLDSISGGECRAVPERTVVRALSSRATPENLSPGAELNKDSLNPSVIREFRSPSLGMTSATPWLMRGRIISPYLSLSTHPESGLKTKKGAENDSLRL